MDKAVIESASSWLVNRHVAHSANKTVSFILYNFQFKKISKKQNVLENMCPDRSLEAWELNTYNETTYIIPGQENRLLILRSQGGRKKYTFS